MRRILLVPLFALGLQGCWIAKLHTTCPSWGGDLSVSDQIPTATQMHVLPDGSRIVFDFQGRLFEVSPASLTVNEVVGAALPEGEVAVSPRYLDETGNIGYTLVSKGPPASCPGSLFIVSPRDHRRVQLTQSSTFDIAPVSVHSGKNVLFLRAARLKEGFWAITNAQPRQWTDFGLYSQDLLGGTPKMLVPGNFSTFVTAGGGRWVLLNDSDESNGRILARLTYDETGVHIATETQRWPASAKCSKVLGASTDDLICITWRKEPVPNTLSVSFLELPGLRVKKIFTLMDERDWLYAWATAVGELFILSFGDNPGTYRFSKVNAADEEPHRVWLFSVYYNHGQFTMK